jgi:tRNA threonylcarbamoyl adenosine modification protein YeaZ
VLTLAVDTSSTVVSAALVDVADASTWRVVGRRDEPAPNRHGELLAALIEEMQHDAAVAATDISAVVAGVGPGPFTGLRVGVVTAATMADALGVPAYAVCSLDAVARAHADGGELLVCSDARRKQVYWAIYDASGLRTDGPDLAPPADHVARFRARDVTAVGAGVLTYPDAFDALRVRDDAAYPSAVDIAALAAARIASGAAPERLEPLYLRRPDAVPPSAHKPVLPV